jgi:hypothetical protein
MTRLVVLVGGELRQAAGVIAAVARIGGTRKNGSSLAPKLEGFSKRSTRRGRGDKNLPFVTEPDLNTDFARIN